MIMKDIIIYYNTIIILLNDNIKILNKNYFFILIEINLKLK